MADILIRGMEMPENCLFCPCSFWDQKTLALWCHALSTYDDNLVAENVTAIEAHCGKPTKAKKPEWCPLVELPEHGRLIDADKLLHPDPSTESTPFAFTACKIIEAPTVISSNKEETE